MRKGLVPQGWLPFSRALSAGLVQEPAGRKLQPKEGSVLAFFALMRNNISNISEEEREVHKLLLSNPLLPARI